MVVSINKRNKKIETHELQELRILGSGRLGPF